MHVIPVALHSHFLIKITQASLIRQCYNNQLYPDDMTLNGNRSTVLKAVLSCAHHKDVIHYIICDYMAPWSRVGPLCDHTPHGLILCQDICVSVLWIPSSMVPPSNIKKKHTKEAPIVFPCISMEFEVISNIRSRHYMVIVSHLNNNIPHHIWLDIIFILIRDFPMCHVLPAMTVLACQC